MNTADEYVVAVIQGTIEPMLVPTGVGFGADQTLVTFNFFDADICGIPSFITHNRHITLCPAPL